MSTSEPEILIIGASTRSAGFSALRAGYKPICLDMFADADLQANAVVRQISNYPDGLIDAIQALPRLPLLYVGGLENHFEILDAAAEYHDLMGNHSEQVREARSLEKIAEVMRMAQVGLPEWKNSDEPPEKDGSWLLRPIFGSGGRGIVRWTPEAASSPTLNEQHIFQKIVEGTSYSALYVAQEAIGDIQFVGVSQQLIGLSECNAAHFQWCGNIAATTLPVEVEHKMRRAGNVLKWKAGVRGAFGIDFVVTDDNVPYVTEVNPRYPASLELLEFATSQTLLNNHIQCFADTDVTGRWSSNSPGPMWGKIVLYAAKDFVFSLDLSPEIKPVGEFPAIADIPEKGREIKQGEPVCTLFATGDSVTECQEALLEKVTNFQSRLY